MISRNDDGSINIIFDVRAAKAIRGIFYEVLELLKDGPDGREAVMTVDAKGSIDITAGFMLIKELTNRIADIDDRVINRLHGYVHAIDESLYVADESRPAVLS